MIPLFMSMIVADSGAEDLKLHLSDNAEQSSYFIARILMDCVNWLLGIFGMQGHTTLFIWIYSILVFGVALGVGLGLQWFVVFVLHKISPYVKSPIYKYLIERKLFTKICRIIPLLLFLVLIQFTLNAHVALSSWLTRITVIFISLVVTDSLCALANVIWANVNDRANKRRLPLNGVVQLIKLLLWVVCVIVIVGILVNKSPGSLLAGLGAFSAVLMLVFKDNIMGVVAGVQLAENDSLHEGDWIVPYGTDANGVVVGVGLTAIKIQNWDKTISTLPPYSLVSNGFKNYRNMSLSNTRRIQRAYFVDADSVVETDDAMLADFAKIPLLSDWIAKKIQQRDSGKVENVNNSEGLADGTIDTNLGVFRAYMRIWLQHNPNISNADTCFVNTLAQTNGGIPLQIYCFTSTSSWIPYEAIQSDVFEHIAVMLHKFRLYVFENPSGRDTIAEGYISPGLDQDYIYGAPYPLPQKKG